MIRGYGDTHWYLPQSNKTLRNQLVGVDYTLRKGEREKAPPYIKKVSYFLFRPLLSRPFLLLVDANWCIYIWFSPCFHVGWSLSNSVTTYLSLHLDLVILVWSHIVIVVVVVVVVVIVGLLTLYMHQYIFTLWAIFWQVSMFSEQNEVFDPLKVEMVYILYYQYPGGTFFKNVFESRQST